MDDSVRSRYYFYLFLCLAIIFIGSLNKIRSFDVWWHLAEGKYNLAHGTILDQEIFSYTVKGQKRFNAYWLYQKFLYLLKVYGGLNGIIFFKALIIVLSYFILFKAAVLGEKAKQQKSRFWIFVLILLLYLGTRSRFMVRPLIFMFFFLISYYYILVLYRDHGRNLLFFLVLLQFIWSGTHTSLFFGQILVGFFLIEAFMRYRFERHDPELAEKHWKQTKILAICLVALLLILLINPYHYHIYFSPLNTYKAFQSFVKVGEVRSPSWPASFPFHYLGVILALVSLYPLLKKQRYAEVFILLFWGSYSFRYVRFIGIFLFLVTPIAIRLGRETTPPLFWQNMFDRKIFKTIINSSLALGVSGMVFWSFAYSPIKWGVGLQPQRYPEKAVEFIKKNIPQKRGLTLYKWGGYFLWNLYPRQSTFIDGRSLPFLDVIKEYNAIFLSPDNFQKTTEKYQLEYVYWIGLSPKTTAARDREFFPPEKWRLVHWDRLGALYLRNTEANQPLISRFSYRYLRPFYPEFDYLPQLFIQHPKAVSKEITRALDTDPTNPVAYLLRAFLNSAKKDFVQAEADYQKTIELDSGYSVAYFNLGQLYQRLNQLDQAENFLTKAVELNRRSVMSFIYLGLVQIRTNKIKSAIDNLHQAVQLETNNALANFATGLAKSLVKESDADHYFKIAENQFAKASEEDRKKIAQLVKTYNLAFFDD